MRFIFIYKGIYIGILLINFYLYHFVKGRAYIGFPASWNLYYYIIVVLQIFYFTWNTFNFSRIWQKKVTGNVLTSEMIICVGKMVMPIAGAFFYHIISPSGYVYLAINHRIWVTFDLHQNPLGLGAPVILFAVVNFLLEAFYFRCLRRYKHDLAANLIPDSSPATPTSSN